MCDVCVCKYAGCRFKCLHTVFGWKDFTYYLKVSKNAFIFIRNVFCKNNLTLPYFTVLCITVWNYANLCHDFSKFLSKQIQIVAILRYCIQTNYLSYYYMIQSNEYLHFWCVNLTHFLMTFASTYHF